MSTIKNIAIDELIKLLTDIKDEKGCTHVDMKTNEKTHTVVFYPVIYTGQNVTPKSDLNLNDLLS